MEKKIMKSVYLNLFIISKNCSIKIIALIFSSLKIFQIAVAQKSLKSESSKLLYL